MRLLFRRDFEAGAAEDIEASSLFTQRWYCVRASRREMDALQVRAPRRCQSSRHSRRHIKIFRGRFRDADGFSQAKQSLLRATALRYASRRTSSNPFLKNTPKKKEQFHVPHSKNT